MKKFDRVIATLLVLQTKHVTKGSELAEKFGVSLRTVYRDIRSLENAGIPVYGEAGVGYSLVEGYKLPPVSFEENEAIALLMGEKFLGNLVDKNTQKAYNSAIDKVKVVVRSIEKDSMQRIQEAVSFTVPGEFSEHDSHPFLQEIIRGIAARKLVKIQYEKPKDKMAEMRILEPIGCYYRFNSWYLIAFCQLRQAYRTFRSDRIQSVEILADTFEDKHPSLNQYLEKEMENQDAIMIVVDFDEDVALFTKSAKYSFGLVNEEKIDQKVRMTFITTSFYGISHWLLGYIDAVQVVDPPELLDYMKRLVNDLNKHYL